MNGDGDLNEDSDDEHNHVYDWENEEPKVSYMCESEDELIGFKRCESTEEDDDDPDFNENEEAEQFDDEEEQFDVEEEEQLADEEEQHADGGHAGEENIEEENNLAEENLMTDFRDGSSIQDEFYDNSAHWDKEFAVGDTFISVVQLRKRVKEYVLKVGFVVKYLKNEKSRFTINCAAKGCPWKLHASAMDDDKSMMIKSYEKEHKCVRKIDQRQADSNWLSTKFQEQLKEHPGQSAKKLELWINKKLGVKVPYMRVWRAREKAIEILGGNPEEAFKLAPKYREMLLRRNPGSSIVLESTPAIERPPLFKRFFCGLEGLKTGFLAGCPPFLFFDGCHLKGKYGGVLLSAVGTDANHGIFPVAWAVVESECKDSWGFFLDCLTQFIGPWDEERHWHFMADRCKV